MHPGLLRIVDAKNLDFMLRAFARVLLKENQKNRFHMVLGDSFALTRISTILPFTHRQQLFSSTSDKNSDSDKHSQTAKRLRKARKAKLMESDKGSVDTSIPVENDKTGEDVKEKKTADVLKELGPPPEKPLPGDCCGSGCERCVWDIYYDELEDYNARKKDLESKK